MEKIWGNERVFKRVISSTAKTSAQELTEMPWQTLSQHLAQTPHLDQEETTDVIEEGKVAYVIRTVTSREFADQLGNKNPNLKWHKMDSNKIQLPEEVLNEVKAHYANSCTGNPFISITELKISKVNHSPPPTCHMPG